MFCTLSIIIYDRENSLFCDKTNILPDKIMKMTEIFIIFDDLNLDSIDYYLNKNNSNFQSIDFLLNEIVLILVLKN